MLLVIANMLGKKPIVQLTVVDCVIEPVSPPPRLTYGHVEPTTPNVLRLYTISSSMDTSISSLSFRARQEKTDR